MRKPIILTPASTNSVKGMSVYRMSDAPPDWEENDPSQPDYIANKDLAEKLRPIYVNDELLLDDTRESGPINFVPGTNIVLTTEKEADKTIIKISATGGGGGGGPYDLPPATAYALGGIKSAKDTSSKVTPNQVYVDQKTYIGEVKAISTDLLTQGAKELVLNGGNTILGIETE